MKKLTSILISLVVTFSSVSTVFGWGPDGHSTVGQIASLRINETTRNRIKLILGKKENLANIANWADLVKDRMGQSDPDKDTNAFLKDQKHNGNNRKWHFDDLPLGCTSYQTCTGFTPDDDVVHMINVCIRRLQGPNDPNHPLSRRNALRMLVHLVGDLHQPLHVGSGYINENGPNHTIVLVTDPTLITNSTKKDVGGNVLIINKSTGKNLHSFWDGNLVHMLMNSKHTSTIESFAQLLKETITPQADWDGQGSIDTWAAQWATDSLNQSRTKAYNSIANLKKRKLVKIVNHKRKVSFVYDVTRDPNYDQLNTPVVGEQLAKGGYRLAALLDAIFQ